MQIQKEFKFDNCANYYEGCPRPPKIRCENKEYCLNCYAKEIYKDLEYSIKYGKNKDIFKRLDKWSAHRLGGAFGKRK